jgi:hypothetical protein
MASIYYEHFFVAQKFNHIHSCHNLQLTNSWVRQEYFLSKTHVIMKKMLLLVGLAACVVACTNETDSATTTTTTRTDTSNNTAATTTTYTATEGDVTYRNGRVQVWRNNSWVDSDQDVTLDNGVVVRRNGRAVRNNEEVELEDGMVVNKSGRFFDKAGNVIEDGWDGVKKGANEAKEGVKKGFNEAKEEVKDVLNKDENKKQQ